MNTPTPAPEAWPIYSGVRDARVLVAVVIGTADDLQVELDRRNLELIESVDPGDAIRPHWSAASTEFVDATEPVPPRGERLQPGDDVRVAVGSVPGSEIDYALGRVETTPSGPTVVVRHPHDHSRPSAERRHFGIDWAEHPAVTFRPGDTLLVIDDAAPGSAPRVGTLEAGSVAALVLRLPDYPYATDDAEKARDDAEHLRFLNDRDEQARRAAADAVALRRGDRTTVRYQSGPGQHTDVAATVTWDEQLGALVVRALGERVGFRNDGEARPVDTVDEASRLTEAATVAKLDGPDATAWTADGMVTVHVRVSVDPAAWREHGTAGPGEDPADALATLVADRIAHCVSEVPALYRSGATVAVGSPS